MVKKLDVGPGGDPHSDFAKLPDGSGCCTLPAPYPAPAPTLGPTWAAWGPLGVPTTGSAKKLPWSPKTHLNGMGMASLQLEVPREQPVFAASVSWFFALMMPLALISEAFHRILLQFPRTELGLESANLGFSTSAQASSRLPTWARCRDRIHAILSKPGK